MAEEGLMYTPLTPEEYATMCAVAGLFLVSWHVPYSFGGGHPASNAAYWPDGGPGVHGGKGLDCSAWVGHALRLLGKAVPPGDHTADDLHKLCGRPSGGKAAADCRPADLAFYGTPTHAHHVMMILIPPQRLAHTPRGVVVGAQIGGPTTNGDDVNAYMGYRDVNWLGDFLGTGRLL